MHWSPISRPRTWRGAAFGLRQSLDTVGAFVGPFAAVGLMLLWANDFQAVFWVATVPAFLAVLLLLFGLHEPAQTQTRRRVNPVRRENVKRLPAAYWWVVGVAAIFTLARFSEAFLVLRAQQTGIPPALVPLVMVAMNVIYAASAYPFGELSDRMSHRRLLGFGLVVLLAADLVLASGPNKLALFGGVALWGVHMGMTQRPAPLRWSAGTAPEDSARLSAYGVFNLISGVAMLVASTLAGLLWDIFGAAATFRAGAVFCLAALVVSRWRTARASIRIEKKPKY